MKALKIALMLLVTVNLSACLADDEEYGAALRQRDEYRAELRDLYQANDQLNQKIAGLYAECEALSDKLAIVAASRMQSEFAGDLLPPPRQRQRPRGTYQTYN